MVLGPLIHLGTLFLEGPQGLVPSTSGIISPALHQRSKLFETRSVQYGHRYLRFLYLGFVISVTSGHLNFMTSPLGISQW